MNIATSIEQSKKLLELGIDSKTADMWWNFYSITYDFGTAMEVPLKEPMLSNFNWFNKENNIPAWSLSALWKLLPLSIKVNEIEYYQTVGRGGTGAYTFEYMNPHKEPWEVDYWLHCTSKSNPIDAVVEMIEWLIENKHLKV